MNETLFIQKKNQFAKQTLLENYRKNYKKIQSIRFSVYCIGVSSDFNNGT